MKCCLTYITQMDPGGWIPTFIVNMLSTKYVPRVIETLRKAAMGYEEWLFNNNKKLNNNNNNIITRDWELGVVPSDLGTLSGSPQRPNNTIILINQRWGIPDDMRSPVVELSSETDLPSPMS
eukprot:Tbor_TRINITY_DN5730_c3_g1::TRINITY_DN5730_c3_g1_i1::g.19914::m.19914